MFWINFYINFKTRLFLWIKHSTKFLNALQRGVRACQWLYFGSGNIITSNIAEGNITGTNNAYNVKNNIDTSLDYDKMESDILTIKNILTNSSYPKSDMDYLNNILDDVKNKNESEIKNKLLREY